MTDAIHGRWYNDACGTAFGLELLGERWSLLILRELMFGARRFTDLRAALQGISAKVLTERLVGLEANGILQGLTISDPAPAHLYELTPWGYAAEPIVQEIGRWAAASPLHNPTLPLSAASFMLSLRSMFDPALAGDLHVTVAFMIGVARFTACLGNGALPAKRGDTDTADLRFEAPSAMHLAALFYGKISPKAAGVHVSGPDDLVGRFIGLFNLPNR